MSAVLVDTNVLVYAVDAAEGGRQGRALEVLDRLATGRLYTSAQVLAEFANVLTHQRKLALSASEAAQEVHDVVRFSEVLAVTPEAVIAALGARDRWQLEYYDAQIWATAALNNVPVVLSEDFSSGTTLGGVTFIDPFADDFDLESL